MIKKQVWLDGFYCEFGVGRLWPWDGFETAVQYTLLYCILSILSGSLYFLNSDDPIQVWPIVISSSSGSSLVKLILGSNRSSHKSFRVQLLKSLYQMLKLSDSDGGFHKKLIFTDNRLPVWEMNPDQGPSPGERCEYGPKDLY